MQNLKKTYSQLPEEFHKSTNPTPVSKPKIICLNRSLANDLSIDTNDETQFLQYFSGNELPVMEAFFTVQGEGYFAGQPSYFLRIGGCDVGCHWCDVKESWDPNLHPLMSVEKIIADLLNFPARLLRIFEPTASNFSSER